MSGGLEPNRMRSPPRRSAARARAASRPVDRPRDQGASCEAAEEVSRDRCRGCRAECRLRLEGTLAGLKAGAQGQRCEKRARQSPCWALGLARVFGSRSQLSGAGLLRAGALCRFHRDGDGLCFCRAVGLLQLDDHLIRPGVALVRLIKDDASRGFNVPALTSLWGPRRADPDRQGSIRRRRNDTNIWRRLR
jgi:hypothetical protein